MKNNAVSAFGHRITGGADSDLVRASETTCGEEGFGRAVGRTEERT